MPYDPKRRRSLADYANQEDKPGAIPTLASLLPQAPANFADNPNIDPTRPVQAQARPTAAVTPLARPTVAPAVAPVAPLAAGGYAPGENPAPYRSPLSRAAAVAPVQQQPLAAPQDGRMLPSQTNGNTADIAGTNARMSAALEQPAAPLAAPQPVYDAPSRGYGGDFDFATNAAARFAANKGDGRTALALQNFIGARDNANNVARNQASNATLALAQAGEAQGRTQNANALLPSEIGLKRSQAQESLARVPLLSAQAGEAQARGNQIGVLTPYEAKLKEAQAGNTNAAAQMSLAQAAGIEQETGNRSLMQPGQFALQSQAMKRGAMDLKQAEELDALRRGALSGDAKAEKRFAQYMKANAGKGDGSVTEEDIITAYVNDRKAQAANPNAGPGQSYAEFKAAITGTTLPIGQNPRALQIQADVQAGKLKPDEAKRQLMALGYK